MLVQLWHRNSRTLGRRTELLLSGEPTVASITRGICALHGIKEARVTGFKLSKQGSDVLSIGLTTTVLETLLLQGGSIRIFMERQNSWCKRHESQRVISSLYKICQSH